MINDEMAGLLAYATGLVNQKLLLQNEYLNGENRILRSQSPKRLRLTDPQRSTLAEIGKRLGRKALSEVAVGSKYRNAIGRPPVSREVAVLIVRMATENPDLGYDRIVGAVSNLGHTVCDKTV